MPTDNYARPRRRKRARMARWLKGEGIEIGALYRPLEPPPGTTVRYVDRLDESGLREHYPELAGERFVPVSIIGSAEDLSQVGDASVDFVIANHLMEHLEYPIRALREFHRVLRPGGVVYVAIPDQRVGIDHRRAPTSLDHILDEHRHGAERNRYDHYLDWVVKAENLPEEGESRARALMERDYSIHFHVWRAHGFLEFLTAACREEGLDFEVVDFSPPEYHGDDEVIVVMVKGAGDAPPRPPERARPWRDRVAGSRLRPILAPPYRAARRVRRAVGRR